MAFPLINPIFQFFDNSGEPLSGGLLHTYAPGTTNPKTTYTDENLSVPNANPIVLDSGGRCNIFLTDGEEYKFVIQTSAGVTLKTVDEVKSPSGLTQAGIGAALYPRSEAEISAGVTPSNYAYLSAESLGGMFRYGAAGDWNGSSGTDDTAALKRLALVVNARGGGVVDLGSRRYRVMSDGSADPVMGFSSLRGVTIISSGAEIAVDKNYSGTTIDQIVQFTDCVGVKLVGNLKFSCTDTQPAGEEANRGPEALVFYDSCGNIDIDSVEASNCRLAVEVRRNSATVTNRARRIRIGNIKATSCGYGLACVLSGDLLTAHVETDACVRSYYPYGVDTQNVTVLSKNHLGNTDCYLATAGGVGSSNITLDYVNVSSTFADNSRTCIRVSFTDQTAAAHIGHRIRARVITGSSAYTGYVLQVEKLDNTEAADTVDRGHVLRDLECQIYIDGDNANQRTIATIGTWGSGEFVTDIRFRNCALDATGQPQFNFLRSLVGIGLFDNCRMTVTPDIPTPVGAGRLLFNSCEAPNFTTSTADTSSATYVECRITDGTNQSVVGKSFSGKTVSGSYTGTLGGVTGSVTCSISYEVSGDWVALNIPSQTGTSNSTALTISGAPALIRPTSNKLFFARYVDNSTTVGFCLIRMGTDGVMTFFDSGGVSTFFTAANDKGPQAVDTGYRLRV